MISLMGKENDLLRASLISSKDTPYRVRDDVVVDECYDQNDLIERR